MGHYLSEMQSDHKSEFEIKREKERKKQLDEMETELCILFKMQPKELNRAIELIFEYKRLMYS